MAYEKVRWKDFPSKDTPIAEDLLNKMDDGIYENDRIIQSLINGQQPAGEATKIGQSTIGHATSPVYINNGVPKECTPSPTIKQSDAGIVSGSAVYSAINNAKVELNNNISAATKDIPGMLSKISQQGVIINENRAVINNMLPRLGTAESSIANLGAIVVGLQQSVGAISNDINAIKSSLGSINTSIDSLNARVTRLESKIK